MQKTLQQFAVLLLVFFGGWFLLSRIDFVGIFHVAELTADKERKVGDFILKGVRRDHKEMHSSEVQSCVDSIARRLCRSNGIQDTSITIHVFIMDEVNAFALPGRHIVVNSALLGYCKSPEELSGVLAHEISHLELHHVTKKLIKEVGLSMLTVMAGGDATGEMGREMARMASSTAFDREQENEADKSAVNLMAKAGIDPEGYANFLFRIARKRGDNLYNMQWLSTHPNSEDRAAEVLRLRSLESFTTVMVIDSTSWNEVQRIVRMKSEKERNNDTDE